MEEILAAARSVDWRALGDRSVCDSCLGRLFGKLEHGLANAERGGAVREIAGIAGDPCWVCGGLTARYDDLAVLVARKLEPWEFETCRRCRGKGCARCGGTGKMYPTSVEEVVAAEVMRESGGTGHALHGMGREDVDARMLGRGRPFIVEIKEPRKRRIDLNAAVRRMNTSGIVEVDQLTPATGADVVALKEDRAAKTYRVLLRTVPPVDEAKLKGTLPVLVGEPIAQRTPGRVVHRRADTIRARRLLSAEVVGVEGDRAELRVTAEAGTYIKEWVHGDGGRTRPSLAERLGAACEVLELDVLDVHDGG